MQCETITGWYDNTCHFDTAASSSRPERQPKKEGTKREKENESEKENEDGTKREKGAAAAMKVWRGNHIREIGSEDQLP